MSTPEGDSVSAVKIDSGDKVALLNANIGTTSMFVTVGVRLLITRSTNHLSQ